MLPTIKLGAYDVSRLIIGGNPFSGNSHVSAELDDEMMDYFTSANIKKTLTDCYNNGINTMQLRGDKHIQRIIREHRLEGIYMHWIAQTIPEIGIFKTQINAILKYEPIAIYHHGTVTDNLFKEKQFDEIKLRLKIIRDTGALVGLGTHMPEVICYAEEHGWDIDFYMASVYNLSKVHRQSSAVTGNANEGEPFDDEDRPLMYKTIRETDKPCLAFKILGATRKCKTRQTVEAAFKEAFANIKPTDAVVVGMYPKNGDQVRENAEIVKKVAL